MLRATTTSANTFSAGIIHFDCCSPRMLPRRLLFIFITGSLSFLSSHLRFVVSANDVFAEWFLATVAGLVRAERGPRQPRDVPLGVHPRWRKMDTKRGTTGMVVKH